MYKHILVAVDGSDTSNLALKEAVKLTKEQDALLLVVHVVDETPAYSMTDIPFPISAYQKVIDRLLLGSVAEGVIRIATKPVLIIRGA